MWTHSLDPLLVLQQQNFKQKVVALLRRFKVSDEVSGQLNEVLCLGCPWHVALRFSVPEAQGTMCGARDKSVLATCKVHVHFPCALWPL